MDENGQVYADLKELVPHSDIQRLEVAVREQEAANKKLLAEIMASENDDG